MRVVACLLLIIFAASSWGCAGNAVNAANTYYNVKRVSKAVDKSFSNENVRNVKANIKKAANRTVNGYTQQADQVAARIRTLAEGLRSGMKGVTKQGRPSIKVDLKKRNLMLSVRKRK